jgi:hypothetical protein
MRLDRRATLSRKLVAPRGAGLKFIKEIRSSWP